MATKTLPRCISKGASDIADFIDQSREDSYGQIQKSYALGLGANGVFQKLEDVVLDCSSPGWDGEGAKPISAGAFQNARKFLESLPIGTEPPEISADSDGSITLEWYRAPKKIVSISIDQEGWGYYAALNGTSRRHGVDSIQMGISDDLYALITQITDFNI